MSKNHISFVSLPILHRLQRAAGLRAPAESPGFRDRPSHKGYSGKVMLWKKDGWAAEVDFCPSPNDRVIAKALIDAAGSPRNYVK